MLEENEKVQAQIIELVIDINHGKLNTALLTPAQLQDAVNHIRKHIPDHLKLPGKKDDRLRTIYKLLTARATTLKNHLVIAVSIPLFNDQVSQLFKVIPIPFMFEGTKMRMLIT